MTPRLDQYGDPVPGDLVVLDIEVEALSTDELEQIASVPWYVKGSGALLDGPILVPYSRVVGLGIETKSSDIGIADDAPLLLVPDIRKHWNAEDGFFTGLYSS